MSDRAGTTSTLSRSDKSCRSSVWFKLQWVGQTRWGWEVGWLVRWSWFIVKRVQNKRIGLWLFRKKKAHLLPLKIASEVVVQVKTFKCISTVKSCDLKWDDCISATIKKAYQRLYFLRQLRKGFFFWSQRERIIEKKNMKQSWLSAFWEKVENTKG